MILHIGKNIPLDAQKHFEKVFGEYLLGDVEKPTVTSHDSKFKYNGWSQRNYPTNFLFNLKLKRYDSIAKIEGSSLEGVANCSIYT